MDLWTDPDLTPYMAVTAHWIQEINGELRLRADLIGFHQVPGHHTGEHLAVAFRYILDRVDIIRRVSRHFKSEFYGFTSSLS